VSSRIASASPPTTAAVAEDWAESDETAEAGGNAVNEEVAKRRGDWAS